VSARDLLVEIGTEELPPKSLLALSDAFTEGLVSALAAAGLKHGKVESFASPRRLAILVKRLAERQPDQEVKRRGPPVSAAFGADGAPTRAATAFAESCGTTVAALGRVTEPKGEFLNFTGIRTGAATEALLLAMVNDSLAKLPIAKRMRWGAGSAEFVRPVHWVVLLYGDEVVPGEILGIATGRHTRGHRFMAPREIAIATPAGYAKKLERTGKVLASFAARRERIRAGVTALAAAEGLTAIIREPLLDEVAALVEWPMPLAGHFEERFLTLPPEVLIATLEDHQRYFPVRDSAGALSSMFITVANIESRDVAVVRAGNERVVRPRLSDAVFFWDADRKQSLASRREALKAVTFQAQLGSYHQKSERVKALARRLAVATRADAALAERAAEIGKCDLLTGLVGEFPELQGVMGSYYARHDGEPAAVADAMAEQYLPRFAGDALPKGPVGATLALAEKLDTLVGIFATGQKPSGTRDPFGLRRAALGFLRIVLEQRLELDLPVLIGAALELARADLASVAAARAPAPGARAPAPPPPAEVVIAEVYDYVLERLRASHLDANDGTTVEMFEAVLERRPASPLDFEARLGALREFLTLADAPALAGANKRIANIQKKAGNSGGGAVRTELLRLAEEKALAAELAALSPGVASLLARRDYTGALRELARLRPAVDAFFDGVMVMDEDPAVRANRFALLEKLRALFLEVADFSRLPG
jgi:glycyl-tRNA synthetase beta chain